MDTKYRTLFGPVPSRRFGRSLGVDLLPMKTCTLDCVFCQLGRTTNQTVVRKPYVDVELVFKELCDWFSSEKRADYITLSGSGEPTLHSQFGEVLAFIRSKTTIPCVLLTNGTLMDDPEVRQGASHADVVKMSLSVWDDNMFFYVNCPHPALELEKIIGGMTAFRQQYPGQIWLEVFLIAGVNDIPADVQKIADIAESIRPNRIHLNTAVRPPAAEFVNEVPAAELHRLTRLFTPKAEVIADYTTQLTNFDRISESTILAMLQRRPCNLNQICGALNLHPNQTLKVLGGLLRSGHIRMTQKHGKKYYMGTRSQTGMINLPSEKKTDH